MLTEESIEKLHREHTVCKENLFSKTNDKHKTNNELEHAQS